MISNDCIMTEEGNAGVSAPEEKTVEIKLNNSGIAINFFIISPS